MTTSEPGFDRETLETAEPEPEPEPDDGDETRSLGKRLAEMVDAEAAAAEVDIDEADALTTAIAEQVAGHHAALVALVGDDVDVKPCPYCLGMGFSTLVLQADPTCSSCPTCLGFGSVTTGSKVDSRTMRPCSTCTGNGFVEAGRPTPADRVGTPDTIIPVILPPSMLPQPPADAAGATG
jgi:hypothetical protein